MHPMTEDSQKEGNSTTMSATSEEIKEWEEEHDELHPIFQVEHRPERISGDDFWEERPSEAMDEPED